MLSSSVDTGARNFDVLITDVRSPIYIVITSASPPEGGTTSGSGTFANGSTDTVNATPNAGYRFVSWTEDDLVVSTSASYTFTGSSDRALIANFVSVPKAATPTISPPGGNFPRHSKRGVRVKLSCATPGATIYYTKNGSDPTTSSRRYPTRKNYKGFKIKGRAGSSRVVKAIATAPGYNNSEITTASFTFGR
jgi:Divergent InlB B-repeat domain/Chitobiase/beta-hexosaminidase C-terminal domain